MYLFHHESPHDLPECFARIPLFLIRYNVFNIIYVVFLLHIFSHVINLIQLTFE